VSASSTDKGLLTPDNCAIIFIDHQPQMFFGVANIDRQDLLNHVLMLAKAAKIFDVPVILKRSNLEGSAETLRRNCLSYSWTQRPSSARA
jgi:nicotinamidase-related amidase